MAKFQAAVLLVLFAGSAHAAGLRSGNKISPTLDSLPDSFFPGGSFNPLKSRTLSASGGAYNPPMSGLAGAAPTTPTMTTGNPTGICQAETEAVTQAHDKVVALQQQLQSANSEFSRTLEDCSKYHHKEIVNHPECDVTSSPGAQKISSAKAELASAQSEMASATASLNGCDANAYERAQNKDDLNHASAKYAEQQAANHMKAQAAANEAARAEDATADEVKAANNAARRGQAETLQGLLDDILNQLKTEETAIRTAYALDLRELEANHDLNLKNANSIRDSQIFALESQVEYRSNEYNAAEANQRVAHRELIAAEILRDTMESAANFSRREESTAVEQASKNHEECVAFAERSHERQERAAHAQDKLNAEFFSDQLKFLDKVREAVSDLQSGQGEGAASKFDNAAETSRRETAAAADAAALAENVAAQGTSRAAAKSERNGIMNQFYHHVARIMNGPDEPAILMPTSNCPEVEGGEDKFVCYESSSGTELFTFASDCEAEFAREHGNTEVSQSNGANRHYEGMSKLHDGSCTQLDTMTDNLEAHTEEEQGGGAEMLSLRQRIRLTSLVHKYVSGDRSVSQNGQIADVLDRIESRIHEEEEAAHKRFTDDIKRFDAEEREAKQKCDSDLEDTRTSFAGLRESAEEKETASAEKHQRKLDKHEEALGLEGAARSLMEEANEQLLRRGPQIEAEYEARANHSFDSYEADLRLATAKKDRDLKYTEEERATIKAVGRLVSKLGLGQERHELGASVAARRNDQAAEALLSIAERVTSRRVYRLAKRVSYDVEADESRESNLNDVQKEREAGRREASARDFRDSLSENARAGALASSTSRDSNLADSDVDSLDDYEAQGRYDDAASGSRDGSTAYTEYKMRDSGAMAQIRTILTGMEGKLEAEVSAADNRRTARLAEALKNKNAREAEAQATYETKVGGLSGIVETAKQNREDAKAKRDVTAAAHDSASTRLVAASAKRTAIESTSEEDTTRYGLEKESCEGAAFSQEQKDTIRVNKQKEEALKYLGEEGKVVSQIRELLKDLNLDFTPTEMGGESYATTDFVQLQSGKKQTLTIKQKAAIRTLVSLAGKLEPRQYIDSSTHGARRTIADLLDEVERTLEAEKASVEKQHGEDLATISKEKADQDARCLSSYTIQVKESNRRVTEARAAETFARAAVGRSGGAHESALDDFSRKDSEYNARVLQQEQGRLIAEKALTSDRNQAQDEYTRHVTHINAEHEIDVAYLQASKKAIEDIFNFIGRSASSATLFAQVVNFRKNMKERPSYIEHSSASAKDKIQSLLTTIEEHLHAELDRVEDEHADDQKRIDAEKRTSDDQAKFFRADDLKKLADVRSFAEGEKARSDKTLAAATAEHLRASQQHNQNMDTLETAKQIQMTNLPIFTRDRDQTLKQATYVFKQEEEIINAKREQAAYYLQAELETLHEIERMLSRVNVLKATPNDFEPTAVGKKEEGPRPVWNLAHNAETWGKINGHEATRARETGFTYDDHTRSDVDDHVLTNFRGEKVKFDTAGELVSEPNTDFVSKVDLDTSAKTTASAVTDEMVNSQAEEALSARAALVQIASRHGVKIAAAATAEMTIEEYLHEVQHEVEQELARVHDDHHGETSRIREMRDKLHGRAHSVFERETKEDQQRVNVAQEKHDESEERLEKAHAEKVEATKVNIQKAAILRDAISTQAHMTPKIEMMFEERMSDNKRAHDDAQQSIDTSFKDAEEYLKKELAVIEEVRPIIDGMDASGGSGGALSPALLQVVRKVVKRTLKRIASKRYDFEARRSEDYENKREENYMENGDQGKQGEKYKKVFTGEGGLNQVIENLRGELQQEIQKVTEAHRRDMAAFTAARQATVSRALKEKREEKAALTAALNKAVKDHHISSHQLDEAQQLMEKGLAYQAKKVQDEKNAMEEQTRNREMQSVALTTATDNANTAYSDETGSFNSTLENTRKLVESELDSIRQIQAFLENGLSRGPAPELHVDRCEEEQGALRASEAEARSAAAACAKESIEEKQVYNYQHDSEGEEQEPQQPFDCTTQEGCRAAAMSEGLVAGGVGYDFAGEYEIKGCYAYRRSKYKGHAYFGTGGNYDSMTRHLSGKVYRPRACNSEPAALLQLRQGNQCARNENAQEELARQKESYKACIGRSTGATDAVIDDEETMETRLLQLRKKYIDKNAEGQKHGDINVVLRVVADIKMKVDSEWKGAQATHAKDVADSTEKRDTEIARAQQRFSDEISHHKTQVSEARKLREEADRKIEEGKQHIKEMQKHDDDMAAAQDAAQEAVNTQFPLLEAEAQNTVESANQIFLNEKTRVDAILASDTSYLEDEIDTLNDVQQILKELNARGGGTV